MPTNFSYRFVYGMVLTGIALLIGFLTLTQPELCASLVEEGGPIEDMSAASYLACLALVVLVVDKSQTSTWCVMIILGLLSLRELDFHNRFTTISITKSKFYISGEVPLIEKAIATAIAATFLGSVYYLARRHAKPVMAETRRREPYAIGATLAIVLLAIAKTCDGFARKLAGLGVAVSSNADRVATAIEESLELGAPLLMLVAIMAKIEMPQQPG